MGIRRASRFMFGIGLCFLLSGWQHSIYAMPFSLQRAEKVALLESPEIRALEAKTEALHQSAIAAGQLTDPKLMLATKNVPVDTFDLSQEPMTQVQVGLQQAFPRGHSLHYRSLQKHYLSVAELHKQEVMRLQVLLGVRLSWLRLYFWLHAREIIRNQKKIFQHLVKVTESMLANNKTQILGSFLRVVGDGT